MGIGLSPMMTVGCEPIPEKFFFVNDTNAPVELSFGDPGERPLHKESIAPGTAYLLRHRPRALHGELLIIRDDDEEQFRDFFRAGITLIDGTGRRTTLDVTKLRTLMTRDEYTSFTMHIRPDLFEPTR